MKHVWGLADSETFLLFNHQRRFTHAGYYLDLQRHPSVNNGSHRVATFAPSVLAELAALPCPTNTSLPQSIAFASIDLTSISHGITFFQTLSQCQ